MRIVMFMLVGAVLASAGVHVWNWQLYVVFLAMVLVQ